MELIATLVAALVFAAIFLFGGRLQMIRKDWRRAGVSFAAGASVAYVFVHLLPELAEAVEGYVEATIDRAISFAEVRIYLAMLVGFVIFYGLEHMSRWAHKSGRRDAPDYGSRDPLFLIHIGGFAAYGALVSYMMVRGVGEQALPVALYTLAMGLHFLSIDHALLEEHKTLYERPGRYVLAAAVLVGWACGILTELPGPWVFILLGLVSGGVVMNSMIMELPGEKEGKFWAFALGAATYTVLMLLIVK